jgi:hypothetical protein
MTVQCCVKQRFTISLHNYVQQDQCCLKRNSKKDVLSEEKLDDIQAQLEASPKMLLCLLALQHTLAECTVTMVQRF